MTFAPESEHQVQQEARKWETRSSTVASGIWSQDPFAVLKMIGEWTPQVIKKVNYI